MPSPPALAACFVLVTLCFAGCKRGPFGSSDPTNPRSNAPSDQFISLMNAGKNALDQADAVGALVIYQKAAAIVPHDADLHLNLANAHLIAGNLEEAIREADEVLKLEPNSAAAYFVKGSAYLRRANAAEAAKALENVRKIDPGEASTMFQLGLAKMGLSQWEEAIAAFKEGIRMEPNRLHAAAHYLMAQALLRAGRKEEAQQELEKHQVNFEGGMPPANAATFERSKFTQARVPFRLAQPEKNGIKVRFRDVTREALGDNAQRFSGPIGVIDPEQTGWSSLFVQEKEKSFCFLKNSNGVFRPDEVRHPAIPGANYFKIVVGDLQNDRFNDLVVLGDKGSHLFTFGKNGVATDVSSQSSLNALRAINGILMDLDFTGKLDLIAVSRDSNDVRIFRQFGPLRFKEITDSSGIPPSLQNVGGVMMEDWNRDGNMDVIASRHDGPPVLLEKQRGGALMPHDLTGLAAGAQFCTGDFDNDLRPDIAAISDQSIAIHYNGGHSLRIGTDRTAAFRQLAAIDYDNDGWLDLWAIGDAIRVWRNTGLSGFEEQTSRLGLDRLEGGAISEIQFADFDRDCDSDLIIALAAGGLRYLRNEGGDANSQLKVKFYGSRSNASGIGCKVEIATGGLRLIRTVHRLPVEIGVGKNHKLDSFLVHWFNWPQGSADVTFQCKEPLIALELTIQEGSCPYLYAWDGERYRFITDILGAAPLGLPLAHGRYIDADPEELVWIGSEQTFLPRDGMYELQITEELREVLYLDEAKLVIVDHPPGTEVHSTDKLLPAKPFSPANIVTLHNEHPLKKAETLDGKDITSALKAVDGQRASPPVLRIPQLRGLAEPHGFILDFGALDTNKPLVLAMNGWLRFGGGMANMAASQDPALPFPFPSVEAEVTPGDWKAVDVTVGAPAGKTKTIIVDLEGKLTPGTRRLRLRQAFEIHWDRIALLEKKPDPQTKITSIAPAKSELRFRGFSEMQNLPPDCPLTPDYDKVRSHSPWTITPGGWCTRYGDVAELIASRDEGLALLNGGDELTLRFARSALPSKPIGSVREFFLYVDGWDKDSDFHVAAGTAVEPLPFHGMNDQLYGREKRPPFASDALHEKYNTRWVEGRVLNHAAVMEKAR